MSSEEIVKLLRRCMFSDTLLQIAADKIEELESETNRQKAEYEDWQEQFRHLDIECERLEKANESQRAEIERLNDKVKRLQESVRLMLNYDDGDERIKSEARKEFVNMAKQRIYKNVSAPTPGQRYVMKKFTELLDNLVKEMEENK